MVIVLARGKRSGIFENLTICHSVAHRMARTMTTLPRLPTDLTFTS